MHMKNNPLRSRGDHNEPKSQLIIFTVLKHFNV